MALTKPKISNINTDIIGFLDPMTVLHQGASQPNIDVGFLFNRSNGLTSNVALYWSESANAIVTSFTNNSGIVNGNVQSTGYANLSIGSMLMVNGAGIYVNGNIGAPGSVLTSTGTSVSWAAAGGFNGGTILNSFIISNTSTATSSTTGAFQTTGGAGIGGNLYVNGISSVAGNATFGANVTVAGNLIVQGTTTTVSSATLDVSDINITVAKGAASAAAANGAGMTVDGAGATLLYTSATDSWNINKQLIGTSASLGDTTTSTSTTTGALVVSGGVGIAGTTYIGANVTVTGSVLPSANVTYNLGSASQRWKDLYLSGSTIYLNNASISASSGKVTFTNDQGGSFSVTGSASGQSTGTFGNLVANSGIASTSTTTGALQVTGGAGINGAIYAGSIFDNGNRVLTNLSSSGAGNLTVSVSAPASTTVALPATGPGATTTGSATAIPVITTDAYGRVSAITTASVSSTLNLSGTSGTGSVSLTNQSLTFAGGNGMTASASGQTITVSTPQNLQTTASPTFAGLTLNPATLVTVNKPSTSGHQTVAQFGTASGGLFLTSDSPIISTGTYYTNGWVSTAATGNYLNLASGALDFSTFSGATPPAAPSFATKFGISNAGVVTVYNNVLPSANVSYNLGSTTAWWNLMYGKSVQAQYADLAENYTSDHPYEPGTVVVFGGEAEITVTTIDHDSAVAGVISTDPAYLMNAIAEGLPVALQGRVPCRVQGPVKKGQVLVTSTTPGVAQAIDNSKFVPGCVIGKALEAINTNNIETIEVVVGKH